MVKSFSDIQPGLLLTGFVRNVMPYGVFVEFPYGLTGLAPKSVRHVALSLLKEVYSQMLRKRCFLVEIISYAALLKDQNSC